jgi:MoxR-like ATPase
VTIDRHHYELPEEFLVIATQNPREFEGTYPLPESQLDRFMLRIEMSYPAREDELAILDRYGGLGAARGDVAAVIAEERATLAAARREVEALHVAPELAGYVLDLAKASRENPHLAVGLSTRGALALLRSARIAAALHGADFVAPDDVKEMFAWVVPHRLVLSPEAQLEGLGEQAIGQRLLDQVPVPR